MAQGSDDFDALARQYWGMWGDALRGGSPAAGPMDGVQGFREALGAWSGTAARGNDFKTVLDHFSRQSGDWTGLMQQVAARFAGRDHSAADIARAWRDALQGAGLDGFQGLFQGMRGPGLQDIGQWSEAAGPWLQQWRSQASAALSTPAFGFTREHQERLQDLAQAQLGWHDALQAYQAVMATASQDAYARFEARLGDHEEPGRQIASARALFDLWVEAAEEAYAEVALSPEYRRSYGALVNAQMRLRAAGQAMAEQQAGLLGLPGRTEVDSAHRKIAELERQVRRLQQAVEEARPSTPEARPVARQPATPASRMPKPAARKAAPEGPHARTPAASKAATQTPVSKASSASKSSRKTSVAPVAKKTSRKTPVASVAKKSSAKTQTSGKPAARRR